MGINDTFVAMCVCGAFVMCTPNLQLQCPHNTQASLLNKHGQGHQPGRPLLVKSHVGGCACDASMCRFPHALDHWHQNKSSVTVEDRMVWTTGRP